MGRSVSIPSNATAVAYQHLDESDIMDEHDWKDYIDDLELEAIRAAPSMYSIRQWVGREGRAIARNDHAMIVVSEYCGLVSIALVPDSESGLAEAWCKRFSAKFIKTFSQLRHIGTASNGEAFFEHI